MFDLEGRPRAALQPCTANAARQRLITVANMRIPGGNAIDRQRRLKPRDYAVDPHRYGHDPKAVFHLPEGGDEHSARIAAAQHQLILRWRSMSDRPSGAELGRTWGFSKQTWSRTINGQRWAGQAALTALTFATHR